MRRKIVVPLPLVSQAATTTTSVAIAHGRLSVRLGSDSGSRARDALALQRLIGNRAVTTTVASMNDRPGVGLGECSTPELTCTARADREHSKNIQVGAPTRKRSKGGDVTYKATGTVTSQFKTNVVIDLATVPDGLSECASKKVAAMIKTKLKPHEEEHKRRFLTRDGKYSYVGPFTKKMSETSDDPATAQQTVAANLEAALDEEVAKRVERHDEYAIKGIDPFHVTTDISDCPECSSE